MPARSRRLIQEDFSDYEKRTKKRKKLKSWKVNVDGPTLLIIGLLLACGLLALFTASYPSAYYSSTISSPLYYVSHQGMYMLGGLAVMLWASRVDYHKWAFWGIPIFGVALILLILVLVPSIGKEINEARRWIYVAGISIQPSEIMKTAVIMTFAWFASQNTERLRHEADFHMKKKSRYLFIRVCQGLLYHKSSNRLIRYLQELAIYSKGIFPYLLALAVISFLLSKEPHLSATIIICATGLGILFVAGLRIRYFLPLIPFVAGAMVLYLMNNAYAMTRIRVWLDPFIDYRGKGWQASQSFIAIGSGGLWGLGLGQGRQKQLYLPEPANDFIFSVICEEMGFIGALVVIVLFAALIYRGFHIARESKDTFGCLLACGITLKIALQVLVNLCVVSGVMPVTGASLPFFSYGGSALLIQLFEMGVLLSVSRNIRISRKGGRSSLPSGQKAFDTKNKAVRKRGS